MKSPIYLIPLLLLIANGQARGKDDEKLGRLFFTHDQRIALDRASGNMPSGEAGPPQSEQSIDGEIWRNAQRRARWINGQYTADAPVEAPAIPVGDRYRHATKEHESLLGDGRLIIKPGRLAK